MVINILFVVCILGSWLWFFYKNFFGNPSYHDVIVVVDGTEYRIRTNYAYQLTCTHTAGWRLYFVWDGRERLVGGEYDSDEFLIRVGHMVVVNNKMKREKEKGQELCKS